MKVFLRILTLLTLSTSVFSQINTTTPYGMPSEQNKEWLATVQNADKDLQFRLVKRRLFDNRHELDPKDKLDVPLLIIDGIPIEDNIDDKRGQFLTTQLTAEMVDIKIMEKEPEGLFINKGFTGIVLIVITDKRMSKRFRKLG